MKKIFYFLMLSATSVSAQDPIVQSILGDMRIDSLIYYASAISGEFAVEVDGTPQTITSRNKNHAGNALAADYLQQKFNEFGLNTTVQSFGPVGENVLATQPGVLYPNQKVVICGHYDSMPTGANSPAADDDGSGTAAVLEAARIMSQYQFAYTLVYAIWDEEEYGLVGSNYYATQAENNGDSLIGVINVDAIAWDGDGDDLARVHVRNHANSLGLSTIATSMISTYGIDLDIEVNNPGATYSDHASFWNHDFSAILIIEDFDNDGNPHYHTTTDLVEYFDTAYFGEISKWAIATAATVAVPLDDNVGIAEMEESAITVFPNPANERITISSERLEGKVSLELTDLSGKLLLSLPKVSLPHTLELKTLAVGPYLLSVTSNTGERIFQQKLIKR